jgi:hypothetical protein
MSPNSKGQRATGLGSRLDSAEQVERSWHQAPGAARAIWHLCGGGADQSHFRGGVEIVNMKLGSVEARFRKVNDVSFLLA